MPPIRYEPDHKGTGALLVTPEMRHLVERAVEDGKAYAISISPDREPYSAGYIASFETEVDVQKIAGSPRVTGILSNTAQYAAVVEWQHDHHVLGRTVDFIENAWFPHG